MEKKEIQEQRMRGYFIQATKEILKGEGLKCINVRSVADRAGYSYATLYNYFKDIKDLIFICVKDFQEECEAYIQSETKDITAGKEKIKAITRTYLHYFTDYPGVFELFFVERINDIGNKQPTTELIYNFLDRLCEVDWKVFMEQNIVTSDQSELMKSELKYITTGLLLYYMNRNQPPAYADFMKNSKKMIDHILE